MKISVSQRLLNWYDPNQRDLPWKKTCDPYAIWLSEIILQQTRVEQGRPYYLKFIDNYPTVGELAEAPIDDILKMWEGLGYYSRARNLHEAAKQVVSEFKGVFPQNYKSLLLLKGVGSYTAAAIASFAYGEAVAVLDGNVYRFLSRLFGESTPIDTTEGKKIFTRLAEEILDPKAPGRHNQAIMDFGAIMCKPVNPKCSECPFRADCVAYAEDRIKELPYKAKKIRKRKRYFNFYVISDHRSVVIEKRQGNDVWKGLYQFPLIEHSDGFKEKASEFPGDPSVLADALSVKVEGVYKQALSHQDLEAQFTEVVVEQLAGIELPQGWKRIPVKEIFTYAYPKIIHSYLSEFPDWLSA